MMTTTPQSQQQPPPLDVIPDSLLALAKDSRYVKECQSLFLQVLSTLLPRRRHQLLEQESWILASLLCLGMMRHTANGTTLGMEAVGLQFPSNASRWKFVLMALATFSWAYAFSSERQRNAAGDRPAITSSPEENDERLQGLSRREFHERQRQAMLQRASQASGYGTNETNNINSNNTTQSSAAAARENTQNQDDDFSLHNSLRRKIKLLAHQLAQVSY